MEASDLQHVRQLRYAWLYIGSLHTLSLALWAAFHLVIHPNASQASHIERSHGATAEEASWMAIRFSVSNAEVTIVEHGARAIQKKPSYRIGKRCSHSQWVLHMLVMIFL